MVTILANLWSNVLGSVASNGSERGKEMTTRRLILTHLGATIMFLLMTVVFPYQSQPQPANATQGATFDHSNCQYPDRWSNPADGCDNSDPAVPECIKSFSTKAGEDACIAAFVAQHEPAPTTPTVTTPEPAKVSECGGK